MAEISVIMPVRNVAPYVGEALRSILTQSFTDFELIVVDDGGTDDTLGIVQRFAEADGRMIVLSQRPAGVAAASNRALGIASGALIARMDGDDVAMPQRLARQRIHLYEHPELVAVGTSVIHMTEDGRPIRARWFDQPFRHDVLHLPPRLTGILHGTALIHATALRRIGGYRTAFPVGSDFDMFLRLAEVGPFTSLGLPLSRIRLRRSSVSHASIPRSAHYAHIALLSAMCRALGREDPVKDDPRIGREVLYRRLGDRYDPRHLECLYRIRLVTELLELGLFEEARTWLADARALAPALSRAAIDWRSWWIRRKLWKLGRRLAEQTSCAPQGRLQPMS